MRSTFAGLSGCALSGRDGSIRRVGTRPRNAAPGLCTMVTMPMVTIFLVLSGSTCACVDLVTACVSGGAGALPGGDPSMRRRGGWLD